MILSEYGKLYKCELFALNIANKFRLSESTRFTKGNELIALIQFLAKDKLGDLPKNGTIYLKGMKKVNILLYVVGQKIKFFLILF